MVSNLTYTSVLDPEPRSSEDHEMTPLSIPSKVVFSSAHNPLRSITPGYRETDIQLLTSEAGRPELERRNSSNDFERQASSYSASAEKKRELCRKIAVSYSALTLYSPLHV
jgi:hypothetical protein